MSSHLKSNPLKSNENRMYDGHLMYDSENPIILNEFFNYDCDMVLWHRGLEPTLKASITELMSSEFNVSINKKVSSQNAMVLLLNELPHLEKISVLAKDIANLVDRFTKLFDQKEVKLRLDTITQTTCPRFHVDNVPCRLITTYSGKCTQWLPELAVDQTKLGKGSNGLSDEVSGIYKDKDQINHLNIGDVALMKGKLWPGNEHAGLVHRSPYYEAGDKRLLMTLDFV